MAKGTYQRVESKIIRRIETGRVAPGARLPSERALAAEFQVSRNTVREAIRALVEKGIIVCRRGAGSFVARDAGERISRSLKKKMAGNQVRLGEIFQVRKMLEPAIAARAAEMIGPDALKELARVLDSQKRALAAGEDPVPFDARFHEILVEATGNSVLAALYHTLTGALSETRDFQPPRRAGLSVDSHTTILNALENRDSRAAFQAMADHMRGMENLLHQMIKDD